MADDGALARVRVPGGVLTAAQAAALADAAVRLGDGALHLTSRGNVQLRGLDGDCGAALAGLLDAAGLLPSYRHERVRNIVASPLSGLDGAGHGDVRPWLGALDGLLCASEAATALSGRFLFALDDGRGDVASLGADVTLIASGAAGAASGDAASGPVEGAASSSAASGPVEGAASGGAVLHIGGAGGALRVRGTDAPRAALVAAEVFLDTAAESRSRAWRVSDLPDGTEELVRETARRLDAAGIGCTYAAGTSLPTGAAPAPGVVSGPDGHRALSVLAPLGTLTAAQWRLLAEVARADGAGEVRLTPWRGVVVPGLDHAAADARLGDLAAAGLITDPASPWHGVGACIGRPGCAKSLADVRADAATALGTGGGLPVYWSGCARRCGHPQGDWVDVVAEQDGYRVSVRGTSPEGPPPATVTEPTPPTAPAALAAAVASARTATACTHTPLTQ